MPQVFSPILTTNLLLELNMSFSIGNFPMFKKQKNLLENVWNKQNKNKTPFDSETNNFKWQ